MRLADFIDANSESILKEWEAFARQIWPGAATDPATLRDDALDMLRAVILDMKSDQTAAQQSGKSKGKNGVLEIGASTAHGTARVASGFDLPTIIAEYRALRASVIRLWRESRPYHDAHDLEDLTRFNESIDQSLSEAVLAFTRVVERDGNAARDEQTKQAGEMREMNDALLSSSVQQHELTEKAKKAEAAVTESDQRYRMLFDLGPVAVYSTDAQGVVQIFNRRAVELWGRTPVPGDTDERFCGSFKMFRPDGTFMPHDQCPMADVLGGTVPFVHNEEVHIERPDGSRVIVIVTIDPMKNEQGEIMGAVNHFFDITERKQAEIGVDMAREQSEIANRAKDRFLAILSHELRTPLTPVLMSIVKMDMNPDLAPSVRRDIAMIRRNVELESRLIDDLLDLSRVISGKLNLNTQTVEVNSAMHHACETCRPFILEKGIHLHTDLPLESLFVEADPARLQQVLWNLLRNAAKFTPEGGDIYVSVSNVPEDRVRVRVRDTGVGIPPEAIPKIFDAFEQGDASVNRQFGGMGLGLSISKALVEMHHGTIGAESGGTNRGATFTIELPLLNDQKLAPAKSQSASHNRGRSKLRALVVEDHADTAEVLSVMLRASGYVVKTAHSAAAALQLAATEPFDVLVSDIGLPDKTGYELMKEIKSRYPMKGIAMSGYGMEEDVRKSHDAGFSDHIVKPADVAQLDRSIQRIASAK